MKISFISSIILTVLLSACVKNGVLIKKRYSKGFYLAHSGKLKKEQPVSPSVITSEVPVQQIIIKQKEETNTKPLTIEKKAEELSHSFNPITSLSSMPKYTNTFVKNISKRVHTKKYNEVDLKRDVISYLALVAIIGLLVALTKIFGLQYTVAVCLIITFVAVAVYLLIRAQINKDPRLLTGDL